MSSLVLCSVSGAPGTTVSALGLALTWPRHVVLVDADRDATQAVLAGYLRGRASGGRGMNGLLQAYRERLPLDEALIANTLDLPEPVLPERRLRLGSASAPEQGDASPRRLFVAGFTHLPTVELFEPAWPGLLDDVRDAPFDVVVDAGRVGHRGLPVGLASGASLVLVVCRTSLVSLAALGAHLPGLLDAAGPGRVGVLLVGAGRPYGAREVTEQFDVPVLGEVAWDAASADDLAHGTSVARGWHRSRLRSSLAAVATSLRPTLASGGPVPAVGIR